MMRRGFSMVMAIFVILILATIAILSLNMAAGTATATTMQYRNEQAQLYARSYTEFAIMAITRYNRATDCVNNINGYIGNPTKQATEYSLGNGYTVQTLIQYIGGTGIPGGCTKPATPNVASLGPDNTVASAIIDVYVKYNDPSLSASEIVYHKRTIQKI